MKNAKILLVEDDPKIVRFLELELKHEGYAVDIAYNGKTGLNKVLEGEQDLVLLDVMLAEMNGFEVLKRIRQEKNVPVIMLTAKDAVSDKVMGLDAGADDYVTKPFAIEELLARVRVALRKSESGLLNSGVCRIADLELDDVTHSVKRAGKACELTKKEYDLLKYLMKNKGIILSRDQILENVWGYEYFGNTNIVDVYIRYLRAKVDDMYDEKLIITGRGMGYCIRGCSDEE